MWRCGAASSGPRYIDEVEPMWAVVFIGAWIAGLLVGLEADVYVPALVSFSLAAAILAYLLKLGGVSP